MSWTIRLSPQTTANEEAASLVFDPDGHVVTPEPAPQALRVLLAEDEPAMRDLLVASLNRAGFDVVVARDGGDLFDYLASTMVSDTLYPPPDVIVTDVRMPRIGGLDVLKAARKIDPTMPIILVTGFGDTRLHDEARKQGARAVFDKPFDLDALTREVRACANPWY